MAHCAVGAPLILPVSVRTEKGTVGPRAFRRSPVKTTLIKLFMAVTLLFATLAISLPGLAQQESPGIPVMSDDNGVNASDLNVMRAIPIFSKPGRGVGFDITVRVYGNPWTTSYNNTNQNIWSSPDMNGGVNSLGSNALFTNFGGFVGYRSVTRNGLCNGSMDVIYSGFILYDAVGNMHPLAIPDLHSHGSCWGYSSAGGSYTTDKSGLYGYIDIGAGVGGNTTNYVIYPDGSMLSRNNTLGYYYEDSNGNYVQLGSSGSNTITDTFGLSPYTVSGSAGIGSVTYTYHGPAGDRNVVAHFTNYYVATNFQCPNVYDFTATGLFPFLTDVTYPDGSRYTVTYEPTPGRGGYTTGRIATITSPEGGTTTYSYPSPNDGVLCTVGIGPLTSNANAISVTKTGGTWQYTRSMNAPSYIPTTTVYTPASGSYPERIITFQSFTYNIPYSVTGGHLWLPVREKYYNGAALELTTDTCYDSHTAPCTSYGISSLLSKTVTNTLSGGKLAKVVSTFADNSLLPTSVAEYDFTNVLVRTTTTQYGSYSGGSCSALGNRIIDKPCRHIVYDGSGSPQSETDYTYDEQAPTSSGSPQHLSVAGSRGNLTTLSMWVGGSGYLTKQYSYFDTGLLNSGTDVNNSVTNYTQAACGNSLATVVTLPLSLSMSATWESSCNGAVPVSAIDMNSKSTSLGYNDNNFWRPTSSTDEFGNASNFSYLYDGYNHPIGEELSLLFNSNNSIADHRANRDSYGRLSVSQTLKGPGATQYDSVEQDYDTSGRLIRRTVPYQAGAGGTNGSAPATTYQYDNLNRLTSITDGSSGTTTYCYYPSASGGCAGSTQTNDVLMTLNAPTGENPKKKQYEYDGLGRLTSVCELSVTLPGVGTCGQAVPQTGYWTKYTYDAVGNLIRIDQNAQGTPQTRTFAYDAIGRRTSETNPESGTTQMFYDTAPSSPGASCVNPSFRGDLVKTYDANKNTVCREYDALHRLTEIGYPGGPNSSATEKKFFVYDSATVNGTTMQNAKGRLAEAYTGSVSSKTSDIGYSYTARGELQTEYIEVPNRSGYTIFSYTYNEAGGLSGMSSSLSGLPSFAFSPNGQGQINLVTASDPTNPTLISNALYNNAGLPTEVDFSSGKKDIFQYDSTFRWLKGTYSIGSSSIVVNPAWNTNGTVQSNAITDPFNSANQQSCSFARDDLARLASVSCGSNWQQNFTYDVFGNITKSGSITWNPGYNPSTNRYTLGGTSYDSNGNLLNDTFHAYTWNSDNKPATIDGLGVYYDAFGAEIGVQTTSTFNQIFDTTVGRIITSSTGLVEARLSMPGGVMAKWGPSGLVGYLHSDWRGNVVASSNPSGNYIGSAAYAPFGEFYAVNNLSSYFMGLGADTASGETDTANREYHWNSGRFIQPDPSGAANLGDPQSLNQYVYVRNTPMESTDPSGLTESSDEKELENKLGGGYQAEKRMERGESAFGGYWGETQSEYMARCCNGGNVSWPIPVGRSIKADPGCVSPCLAVRPGSTSAEVSSPGPTEAGVLLAQNFLRSQFVDNAVGFGFGMSKLGSAIGKVTDKICGGAGMNCFGLPIAGFAIEGELPALAEGEVSTMDPALVRFSQDSISPDFKAGNSVSELAEGLKSGKVNPASVPPIRLVENNGKLYTLDNRRLAAFQKAGVRIRVRMATPQEAAKEGYKFTTTNDGTSVRIRGQQ
jgi:RHS repeat-associated protein